MDGALAELDLSFFLLDLRPADTAPAARRWLEQERERIAQDATAWQVPRTAFDLVYFVPEVTRARPTPAAIQRRGQGTPVLPIVLR